MYNSLNTGASVGFDAVGLHHQIEGDGSRRRGSQRAGGCGSAVLLVAESGVDDQRAYQLVLVEREDARAVVIRHG